ncbi:MAG: DUF3667 domain-containing protein [Bacteroidota bacterium]
MTQNNKLPFCSNCNYQFKDADNFCPVCGQKNHETKIPLKHFFEEFIEHVFHLDSKIFITLKTLVFSPGKLSIEYNNGKRVKYFTPLRLYILISFLFFFLLNLLTPKSIENLKDGVPKEKFSLNFSFKGITTGEIAQLNEAQFDSLLTERKIERSSYNIYMLKQLYKISNSSRSEFIHSLIKNISYMMFLLMPGFALLIFLIYKRKMEYYTESFIVSVHFHSFAFLFFSVMLLLSLQKTIFFLLITIIVVPVYNFLMLKKIFRQKKLITLLKTFLIGILYLLLLVLLFSTTVVISIVLV